MPPLAKPLTTEFQLKFSTRTTSIACSIVNPPATTKALHNMRNVRLRSNRSMSMQRSFNLVLVTSHSRVKRHRCDASPLRLSLRPDSVLSRRAAPHDSPVRECRPSNSPRTSSRKNDCTRNAFIRERCAYQYYFYNCSIHKFKRKKKREEKRKTESFGINQQIPERWKKRKCRCS